MHMRSHNDEPASGQQLAIFGAAMAADKADRVHGSWSDLAWDYFVRFARSRNGQPFMAEDVRAQAAADGAVPRPPDGRAWGAILMRASKAALIRRIGYAPMKDPRCHANPKAVWVWVG